MRFLFASDFICDWNSGSAGSILAIGDALGKRGHTIDYLWRDNQIPPPPHPTLDRLFALPRRQFRQIQQQLNKASYDAVIVSQPYAYSVYEKLSKLHPGTLFLNRTHGWEDRFNLARLKWAWDLEKRTPEWMLAWASATFARRIFRRTVIACHGLISPSSICADFISNSYGIPKSKIAVIPYGLSPEFLNIDTNGRSSTQQIKMLFIGNYIALKGTRMLEAMLPSLARLYPNAALTFVVPSGSIDLVREKYGSAFGDRLTVLGWQKRCELVELYSRHDIYLFPSLFEGFGKVFLEAMACGMCVVGFDEGGISDIAASGESAMFCESGDEAAFYKLLNTCLNNPELTRKIGLTAQKIVRTYTWERTATETEIFCQQLMEKHYRLSDTSKVTSQRERLQKLSAH
jgi:glycosyltransferase involved in cell wall biosynthesis